MDKIGETLQTSRRAASKYHDNTEATGEITCLPVPPVHWRSAEQLRRVQRVRAVDDSMSVCLSASVCVCLSRQSFCLCLSVSVCGDKQKTSYVRCFVFMFFSEHVHVLLLCIIRILLHSGYSGTSPKCISTCDHLLIVFILWLTNCHVNSGLIYF